MGYLCCRGIRIHYYLDDWLIVASSLEPSPVPSSGVTLCSVPRLPDQLGEVFPGSFSGPNLSRGSSGLSSSASSSCRPPNPGPLPGSFVPGFLSLSSGSPLAAVSGSLIQSQGLGCELPLFDASSLDLFSVPLPTPSGLSRPPDSFVSIDQGSLSGVGISRFLVGKPFVPPLLL